MSASALLVLWLAAGPQVLLDEVFHVPAGEWRYVPVILKQPPATVVCDFRVISGNGAVRVVLVNRDGLDTLRGGDREPLGSGAFTQQGQFSRLVSMPDEYAVVLENGGRGQVDVRLRVSLDFSARGRPRAQVLSPERRFAVIVISATVFLGIVFYSARRLLGVMR
jgi:hypothetical protein